MNSKLLIAAGLLLAIGFTGCAGIKDTMRVSQKNSQWNPVKKLTESKAEEAEPTVPNTVTVLWKESHYEKPGQKPVRGFGGRVFFHDVNNNPVEADGELTVYGYDESKKDTESQTADKKFVFSSAELKSLLGDSGFGTSYNIWIPWDEVGGMRKTIALIPMFKTSEEIPRVIKSGQSLNVLHGTIADKSEVSDGRPYKVLGSSPAVVNQGNVDVTKVRSGNSEIAQVAFQSQANEEPTSIKTSTIRMTPSMSQRIAAQNVARKERQFPLGGNWNPDAQEGAPVAVPAAELKAETSSANGWISNLKEQASKPTGSDLERNVFGAPGKFK